MGGPISLRNLPPHALHLARRLCEQTGLSMADVLRQAIMSGLLIQASRLTPAEDGTLGGMQGATLARALRRHLASAIDLLLEYEQHPYRMAGMGESNTAQEHHPQASTKAEETPQAPEKGQQVGSALGNDLEMLGLDQGLSAVMEPNRWSGNR